MLSSTAGALCPAKLGANAPFDYSFTQAELFKYWQPGFESYSVPAGNNFGFNVIIVNTLSPPDETVLIRVNGNLEIVSYAEYTRRYKRLRLVGSDTQKVEYLGSVVFARACFSDRYCDSCRLCEGFSLNAARLS